VTTLAQAVEDLRGGDVVVIPTDTVYGLAADCTAAADLFRLKRRPQTLALPVLAATVADLERVAVFSASARRIATRLWPGPLTLVLERAPSFDADLGGDGATVAVRIPAHKLALEVLKQSGPVAVTSANRSGRPPATTVAEARAIFSSEINTFVDGGLCDGPPSSVVSAVGELELLRAGALSLEHVAQALR
jgi:tRNA threonylcarbamoyl adenosine modification protein (Sua5/YciO/YrdC/YwlC family)